MPVARARPASSPTRSSRRATRVERRWRYLIVGAASKEDADALAARVHGEVEPGGELVWETVPGNPFAVFGGLGGSGTPSASLGAG